MVILSELEMYCNRLLNVEDFQDFCPNGVQVSNDRNHVEFLVSGVSASLDLIDLAFQARADTILVHHGWFWNKEPRTFRGFRGKRLRHLVRADLNLIAYHLPLDAHEIYGNNKKVGELLGFSQGKPIRPKCLVWGEFLAEPIVADELADRIQRRMGRIPVVVASGPSKISSVAWCTGAAQNQIELAAEWGFDAFISGEISESTTHYARELGIHYFSAGHHATERYGVKALGDHLAAKFGLRHKFFDLDNPA